MFHLDVNWLGVILATVLTVVIGGFWYSPALFGNIWAKSHGFDTNTLKPSPISYGAAVFVGFLICLILGAFIRVLPVGSLYDGAKVGFFVWLGFIASTQFAGVIWAGKSIVSYFIDVGYYLVSLVLAGIVLALFR